MQKSISTTRKKPAGKSKFKLANWFHAHNEAKLKIFADSGGADSMATRLWPVTRDYYAPVDLIFLSQAYNPLRMNQRPVWLARDGLVPLLWFFKMNPDPGPFMQQLLVHESLGAYVPPAWRSVTGTYRIVNSPERQKREVTSLLVTSLVSEAFCSLKGLRDEMQSLKSRFPADALARLKKYCYLPWGFNANRPEYQSEFTIELCRELGAHDLEPLTYARIDSTNSFAGTELVELNENLLCADNYLAHLVLQRGGQLRTAAALGEGCFVSLSPYHGYELQEQILAPYALETDERPVYYSRFDEIMQSAANTNFPWPTWVKRWQPPEPASVPKAPVSLKKRGLDV